MQQLKQPSDMPQFCFLHFWYTHGGYGMSGIPGAPSLRWLVDQGRTDEALRIYYAAATHILEFKLVEILKQLQLSEWAIFIFGDHGEGYLRRDCRSRRYAQSERATRTAVSTYPPA